MEPTLESTTTTTGPTPEAAPIQAQRIEKTNLVDRVTREAFPDEFKPAEPAAAKPAETTAEAPKVEDLDSVPAEIKSPKGAENWKRIRSERDAAAKEAAELRRQIEEFKKAPAAKAAEPSADIEALRKERDQYSEQLRILGIEKHPKFETFYANKTAAVIDSVKTAIGGEQGEAIAKILAQPNSPNRKAQLNEALAALDPFDASQVGAAYLELQKISGERNAEIQRASQDYTRYQEAQKLQQQQRAEQLNKTFDSELEKATKAIEFLQTREGNEEWNNGVKQLIGNARNIFNGSDLTEGDAARAAMWASVGPLYQKAAVNSHAEIQKLQAEIKSLKSATPAPGGGADPVQTQPVKYNNSIDAIVALAENNGFVKKA